MVNKELNSKIMKKNKVTVVYADFKSILVPENNGKQNAEESYTNKYQKHIACSYGYKFVCVDDKPFKTYVDEDAVYNFINIIIEESKHCSDVMKKYFNKELVMTKKCNKNFKNSTKCWICDNDYVDNDVKVRDHCHIIGKYRGSAHRDCNINLRLNDKLPVVFQNLKNYDSHLIMQELGKFDLKTSVILNGLETYMSFTINNKLSFSSSSIISFSLSSSLDSVLKNLNEDDFKYLSQEFDKNKLDQVKQKGFYPYEYMSDFEMFKEELPTK